MYNNPEPLTLEEIMSGLNLKPHLRPEIQKIVVEMCRDGELSLTGDRRYTTARAKNTAEGILEVSARGVGIVRIRATGHHPEREVVVFPEAMGSARHGDRVLLRVAKGQDRGPGARVKAQVVRVLARSNRAVVGIYLGGMKTGSVVPEEARYPFNILIRSENSLGAKNGDAVVAEIFDFPDSAQQSLEGRIREVLGSPDDFLVQAEMVIREFNLPRIFPEEVLDQAAALPEEIPLDPKRMDLRQILHVTIDGETARDFDDAVAVEKTRRGFQLHVSIADVSLYVTPGTPLDQEAYTRGTSVYFPFLVLPMLPERLSNHLCSLVPLVDRPAVTAILDFDRDGTLLKKEFMRSIIRSHARLTYTTVRQILVDKDADVRKGHKELCKPLRYMEELALVLEKKRMNRGSIGFELPEADILMSEDGKVTDICRRERNLAHRIIEEFMLAANEAVAATFSERNIPALYRIHESPDNQKVLEFQQFAGSLGLMLPSEPGTPSWFGKILALVKGTPKEYIVNNLLLRTMQRARYAPDNVGHFGLAATHYTHFTSPIRRYPDLLVHRALLELLLGQGRKKSGKDAQTAAPSLAEQGEFLSGRERASMEAERAMDDRLRVQFMEEKIGHCYEGIISGLSPFALFVELTDTFVSGAVAITDLTDDYYNFDEKRHRFIGRRSNRTLQMGDIVRVQVKGVDKRRRWVNFVLLDPAAGDCPPLEG